jgi:hypothetical protein
LVSCETLDPYLYLYEHAPFGILLYINEEYIMVIILHARKKLMCSNKILPQQNVGGIN